LTVYYVACISSQYQQLFTFLWKISNCCLDAYIVFTLQTLAHPVDYPYVLTKSRPQELAFVGSSEPVDVVYPRHLTAHRSAQSTLSILALSVSGSTILFSKRSFLVKTRYPGVSHLRTGHFSKWKTGLASIGWRFGVAVTCWSRSTQLLYIEPG